MDHFADILYNIELSNQQYFNENIIYDNHILLLLFSFITVLITILYIFVRFNWCNYIPVIEESYEHNEFIITPISTNNVKEKYKIKELDFEIFHIYHMLRAGFIKKYSSVIY